MSHSMLQTIGAIIDREDTAAGKEKARLVLEVMRLLPIPALNAAVNSLSAWHLPQHVARGAVNEAWWAAIDAIAKEAGL